VPRHVEPGGAFLARADAVFPAEAGDEVAARVADQAGVQLAHEVEHVLAEAVRVGGGVSGFVDPGVHGAAHVLDERAEEPGRDGGDHVVAGDAEPGVQHGRDPL
jgi:hypothetical protein